MPRSPAEADDGGADTIMEPTEEVPETPPPSATTAAPEMTPGDLALVRGEAVATSLPPQPVTEFLALPAPTTGDRRRACPGCGHQHHVGQMICLGCGGSIIKASSQQQRRRMKTGRWFREEAAARATGKRRSRAHSGRRDPQHAPRGRQSRSSIFGFCSPREGQTDFQARREARVQKHRREVRQRCGVYTPFPPWLDR